jgi:E3 ubiquitin-protein ligase SHPRH
MGLGKTVEVLALVVANPCPLRRESCNAQISDNMMRSSERSTNACGVEVVCMCGVNETIEGDPENVLAELVMCSKCNEWSHMHCVGLNLAMDVSKWTCSKCLSMEVMQAGLIDSPATLIVCPAPILSQWESEIDKHIVRGSLKVVKYLGQEQPGCSKKNNIVTPYDLAMADIVLTTYDVLRHDFHCNPDRSSIRSLRYEKRYHVIPTPLTSVRFWRVVVDEAQMVESSTAKATEMVKKIASINLWCVTGTPISRGLEDLFGLFAFLRSEPYGHKHWWNQLIQRPLESFHDKYEYEMALNILINVLKPSLGGVMWRSSKIDVSHEIRLPDQTICRCTLQFSKIERHFYERQHRDCQGAAQKALPKATRKALDAQLSQGANGHIKIKEEDILHDRLLTKKEELVD